MLGEIALPNYVSRNRTSATFDVMPLPAARGSTTTNSKISEHNINLFYHIRISHNAQERGCIWSLLDENGNAGLHASNAKPTCMEICEVSAQAVLKQLLDASLRW